jgi:Mg-chelatase subunit ChlD
MHKLLYIRSIERSPLVPADYIDTAVCSTYYCDQQSAKETAKSILFDRDGNRKQAGLSPDEMSEDDKILFDELLSLQRIYREQQISEKLKKSKVDDVKEFFNQVYSSFAMTQMLSVVGGEDALLTNGIKDLDKFKEFYTQEIRTRINSLTPDELIAGCKLGLADTIIKESLRDWEKAAAQVLSGKQDLDSAFDAVQSFESKLNLLRFMQHAKYDVTSQAARLDVSNMRQLADLVKNTGIVPGTDKLQQIVQNTMKELGLEQCLSMASGTIVPSDDDTVDLTDIAYSVYSSSRTGRVPDPSLLARFPAMTETWQDLLTKSVESMPQNTDDLYRKLVDMKTVSAQCPDVRCGKYIDSACASVGNKLVLSCKTADELLHFVKLMLKRNMQLDYEFVKKTGDKLGVDEGDLRDLFQPDIETLKKMIADTNRPRVYEVFYELLTRIRPDERQTHELACIAVRSQNNPALAALGNYNLYITLKAAESFNGPGIDYTLSVLSAGQGENLLYQWFAHRDKFDSPVRKKVKEHVRRLLVELGIIYARHNVGTAESGMLPSELTRQYRDDDDHDAIDIDETVYNIVSAGKKSELVDRNDLIVRTTQQGRKSVCLNIDISGSMDGEKLAYMSISSVMLVYALKKQEIAICFFESDTHVLKTFCDDKSVDDLADDLLELKSQGGTMIKKALEWTIDQFESVDTREKMYLLFTDAAIFDLHECTKELSQLPAMEIKSVMIVPAAEFAESEMSFVTEKTGASVVRLLHWHEFPAMISEAIK